jgi:riboflavin synthase
MFTGIIETIGQVQMIEEKGSNFDIIISSNISAELKIDQSLAHNGVCLTVTNLTANTHTVTAVAETLERTNLKYLKIGDRLNLERAMAFNGRIDGHIVQGHVDTTGICTKILDLNGSWEYHFNYKENTDYILVDKGSICVNGVSLTVVNPGIDFFNVAIIPYTFEHTTFKDLKVNEEVNLEFDIIGKYIAKYANLYKNKI